MSEDQDPVTVFGSLPVGRRLEQPDRPANYAGTMRVLPQADKDSITFARRHWPEAKEQDFERQGKAWVDKATGVEYKRVRFNPLVTTDPKTTGVSTFIVTDDSLIFLRKADEPAPVAERLVLGEVGAREVTGKEPLGMAPPEVY
jgi:hypothetical protein